MSETKAGESLTPEQSNSVGGGGECTLQDVENALNNLKDNYEKLVDFTSYLIERVAGQ
jgi:hypothetical protein